MFKRINVKRNIKLSYITVFAAVYDNEKNMTDFIMKRLEPSDADTVETVEFTDEYHSGGLAIPENGNAYVFVWNGAFVDNSMNMKPLSKKYNLTQMSAAS